jgi:hypothetical protein
VLRAIAERWRRLVAQGGGHFDISAARLGLDAGPQADDDARVQPIAAP